VTIQDRTRQALKNYETILAAGGASLDDVVEVGVLLHDPADFSGFNGEWERWFPSNPPARYAAKLGAVIPGATGSQTVEPSRRMNHKSRNLHNTFRGKHRVPEFPDLEFP